MFCNIFRTLEAIDPSYTDTVVYILRMSSFPTSPFELNFISQHNGDANYYSATDRKAHT